MPQQIISGKRAWGKVRKLAAKEKPPIIKRAVGRRIEYYEAGQPQQDHPTLQTK